MVTLTGTTIRYRHLKHIPVLGKTELTQDVSSGLQTIGVQSLPSSLGSGTYYAIIGHERTDRCEVVSISNVTDTSFDASLTLSHRKGEPVKITNVYKARLYSSTTIDGSYSLVGSFDLDFKNPDGILISGVNIDTDNYYKVVFVANNNGTDEEIDDLANIDAFQVENLNIKNHWATIDEVLAEVGQQYEQDYSERIWSYILAAEDEVKNTLTSAGYSISNPSFDLKHLVVSLASAYLLRSARDLEASDFYFNRASKMLEEIKNRKYTPGDTLRESHVGYSFPSENDRLAKFDQEW